MKTVLFGLALLIAASSIAGETKVLVSDVHICCKACVVGIETALKDSKGVKFTVDKDKGTVALTADDAASAQSAVNALGTAGYYGKSDNKDIAFKAGTVPDGKVAKLVVSGIHNCCAKCCTAIVKAIKTVPGVKDTTAKPKLTSFDVTGDFDAKAVVKALNDAGFEAQVK